MPIEKLTGNRLTDIEILAHARWFLTAYRGVFVECRWGLAYLVWYWHMLNAPFEECN